MSLRGFHIVFITFSTLLAIACGAWCLWVNSIVGAPVYMAGAIGAFFSAVVLIIYGVWFWRKMKRLGLIA